MHEKSQIGEHVVSITPSYYLESAEMLLDRVSAPSAELLAVLAVGSMALGDENRALALAGGIEQLEKPEWLKDVYLASIDLGLEMVQSRLTDLPTKLFHRPAQQVDLLLGLIQRGIHMDTNADYARTVIDSAPEYSGINEEHAFKLISVLLSTGDIAGAVVMAEHFYSDASSLSLMKDVIDHLHTKKGPLAKRKLRKDIFQTCNTALLRHQRICEPDRYSMDAYTNRWAKERATQLEVQQNEYVPAFFAAVLLAESGDEKAIESLGLLLLRQSKIIIPIINPNAFEYVTLPAGVQAMEDSQFLNSWQKKHSPSDIEGVLAMMMADISGRKVHSSCVEIQSYFEAKYQDIARRLDARDNGSVSMRVILDLTLGANSSEPMEGGALTSTEQYELQKAQEALIAGQYYYGIHAAMEHGGSDVELSDHRSQAIGRSAKEFSELDLEIASFITDTKYWQNEHTTRAGGAEFQQHALRASLENRLDGMLSTAKDLGLGTLKCQYYIKILEGYAVLDGGLESLDAKTVDTFNDPDNHFMIGVSASKQEGVLKKLLFAAVDCEILGYYPDYSRESVVSVLSAYGIDGSQAIDNTKKRQLAMNAEYSYKRRRNF